MARLMAVLVTGVAGFIGSWTARALLDRGEDVIGIDNLNDYYDPSLKQARLKSLSSRFDNRFRFEQVDFSDAAALARLSDSSDFDRIVHLGAQAGVRYSIENPQAYVQSNLVGHCNMNKDLRTGSEEIAKLLLIWRNSERDCPGSGLRP